MAPAIPLIFNYLGHIDITLFFAPFVLVPLHYFFTQVPRSPQRTVELLFLYTVLCYIGLSASFLGILKIFWGKQLAATFGKVWTSYYAKVGIAKLSFGILGLMCWWSRHGFRTATALGFSLMIFMGWAWWLSDILSKGGNLFAQPWWFYTELLKVVIILTFLYFYRTMRVGIEGPFMIRIIRFLRIR